MEGQAGSDSDSDSNSDRRGRTGLAGFSNTRSAKAKEKGEKCVLPRMEWICKWEAMFVDGFGFGFGSGSNSHTQDLKRDNT